MSGLSVASFFPFRRLKVFYQDVNAEVTEAHIMTRADLRFTPVCQACGSKVSGVHSWTRHKIRDLNMATATVWVSCYIARYIVLIASAFMSRISVFSIPICGSPGGWPDTYINCAG